MTGRPSPTRGVSTACATLVIIPGQLHASHVIGVGRANSLCFTAPAAGASRRPTNLPPCITSPNSWPGSTPTATDPRYLDDPANADICESLRELLRQWCAAESDYDPHATLLAGAHSPRCRPPGR